MHCIKLILSTQGLILLGSNVICHPDFPLPHFRQAAVTDHSLMVENIRERLSVRKRAKSNFDMERFDLKKLNRVYGREKY
jgi:hypothetical protein